MTSKQIRSTFFKFFESKGHEIVKSAPIVQKNDPTLMFTNAGMNQFKDYFLGNREPKVLRVADSQKCLRVSGKHNDLEEVGVDTYHHTMFEMLGNWSFGDYFKQEAIDWAWELLTEVYKIEKDRLYITIFSGDSADGLEEDQEARQLWQKHIPADRVLGFDKKDNFWEMGSVGPCGPCSEIHVDMRNDKDRSKVDGATLVNKDHPQVIEIWNLVFIQYNRLKNGTLENLPNKHIDTGMGLERLVMVLQAKQSNYDSDIFTPFIQQLENFSDKTYQFSDSKEDVAMRVIADHLRAVTFCIADGQLPSNNGAGYVVRRILRRAIRYGYSYLGIKQPFIYSLVELLTTQMGDVFNELEAQKTLIKQVIKEEEESFLRTLAKGIERLQKIVSNTSGSEVSGKAVFELYDTYGFPLDLTQLMLREQDKEANIAEFNAQLEAQKTRSRAASESDKQDWVEVINSTNQEFVGYGQLSSNSKLVKYRQVNQQDKDFFELVFDVTPFYAEGGGQVGDRGTLSAGAEVVNIWDTKRENETIIHFVDTLPAELTVDFILNVDSRKRTNTQLNHTATHLMHFALREVLGSHVEQRGSLVNEDYLRFDFSHFQKVGKEEIEQIESLVNNLIRKNTPLTEHKSMELSEAKDLGAMALFGEKYGDKVRVIQFDESIELCGGTHVQSTGEIGLFKIVAEQAVSSGIRRIEAVTGSGAISYVNEFIESQQALQQKLKTNDINRSIDQLINKNKSLTQELEKLKSSLTSDVKSTIAEKVTVVNGFNVIAEKVEVDPKKGKDLCFQLKKEIENGVVLIVVSQNGKVNLNLGISDRLAESGKLHAGNLIKEVAKEVNGGGGGQPFFASAGGSNPDGIPNAIEKLYALIKG